MRNRVFAQEKHGPEIHVQHLVPIFLRQFKHRFESHHGGVIDDYVDEAEGILEKRPDRKMAMTHVTLHPRITWSGGAPDEASIAELHDRAHQACFIANSVTTEVTIDQ